MKLIILRLATPGFNTPSLRDLFAKQIVEFEDYTDGGGVRLASLTLLLLYD